MQPFRKFTNSGGGGVTGLLSASGGTAIADNKIIRGDGTTGIQGSGVSISDVDVVSGITQLNVDNLQLDGNSLISTNANGDINLDPNGTGNVVITSGSLLGTVVSGGDGVTPYGQLSAYGILLADRPLTGGVTVGAPDVGIGRSAAGWWTINNGAWNSYATKGNLIAGWIQSDSGFKRKTADQTVTNSTTLVDDSHLSVSLAAGRSYGFKFILFATEVATSGLKIALAGGATHTNIIADVTYVPIDDLTSSTCTRLTAVGTVYDLVSNFTSSRVIIEGTTTVNAAGTFLVQFAQSAETGAAETVTLLRGSTLEVWDIA